MSRAEQEAFVNEVLDSIETAKQTKAQSEGAIEQLKKQLEQDFGASTPKQAKALLEKTQKEIPQLEAQVAQGIEALREKLPHE